MDQDNHDDTTGARSRLVENYRRLADLTSPLCATRCRCPQSCCSAEYCGMAMEIARDLWGMRLEPTGHPALPLMGEHGCTAPPHVRPLCTRHLCSISAFGVDPDPAVTAEYFELIDAIDAGEEALFTDVADRMLSGGNATEPAG